MDNRRETCGTMPDGDVIYTIYGLAKLLAISNVTAYRYLVKKIIPSGKFGRQYRILGSSIREFLKGQKARSHRPMAAVIPDSQERAFCPF
jgi:excisionase family DNA binding protein